MITFEDIVNGANKNDLKIETWTSVFDRWGDEVVPKTFIQVEIGNHFSACWSFFTDDLRFGFFDGRYNAANGLTQKTFKKEQVCLAKLGL